MLAVCDKEKNKKQIQDVTNILTGGVSYLSVETKQLKKVLRIKTPDKKDSNQTIDIVLTYGSDRFPPKTVTVDLAEETVEFPTWPGKITLKAKYNGKEAVSEIAMRAWNLEAENCTFKVLSEKVRPFSIAYDRSRRTINWELNKKLIPKNAKKLEIMVYDETGNKGLYNDSFDFEVKSLSIHDINNKMVYDGIKDPNQSKYVVYAFFVDDKGKQLGNVEILNIP
jgi:hypothetical protein